MKNFLIVISGPAGVGKGTLVNRLMEEDKTLALSVSETTRAPRTGERNGVEYFFITREQFEENIKKGNYLEYDDHFSSFYGTPKPFVEEKLKTHSVVLEIDVNGALAVREACEKAGIRSLLIMIAPPDLETLEKRLAGRKTEGEVQRKERLARACYELAKSDKYDYTVVNDDLDTAYARLRDIIKNERNKDR